ncbi:MAG: hypothetical protein IH991_04580 [Planctomycetes bacterium]|nr:hypothetical protein [Planctomycetota bacterium]
MRFRFAGVAVAAAVMCFASLAEAQPGRGGRGGGGVDRLTLLANEAVQKELELLKGQIADLDKLREESRRNGGNFFRGGGGGGQDGFRRPGGNRQGGGRRPGGDRGRPQRPPSGDDAALFQPGEFFVQAEEEEEEQPRRRFQDLSEEERQKLIEGFRKQRAERQTKQIVGIKKILLDHQYDRLNEIFIQVQGVNALRDDEVAKKLKIMPKQQEEMRKVEDKARETIRTEIRAFFESGGDRDSIGEKFTELRKENDKKILACLSSSQQKKFEDMKGEPFDVSKITSGRSGRGGDRGRGRGQGRDRGPGGGQGRREGGQRRPQRPDA